MTTSIMTRCCTRSYKVLSRTSFNIASKPSAVKQTRCLHLASSLLGRVPSLTNTSISFHRISLPLTRSLTVSSVLGKVKKDAAGPVLDLSAEEYLDLPPSTMRVKYLNGLKKDYGNEYDTLTVKTGELLNALRDMQSWRQLTPATAKSADFRDALRCISLLAGPDGGKSRPELKLKDIEGVLSDENGVTWRLIRHLIEDGLVPELEALDEKWKAMVMFNRVHGFGKVKAQDYVNHGARTLDDLLNAKDKEYGRKVSDAQKLAIRYHQEMDLMIPRSEVGEFEKLIKGALAKVDPTLGFEIMGSYRRGEFVSSDIDMVVWHKSYARRDREEKSKKGGYTKDSLMGKVMGALIDEGLIDEEKLFSRGEKKVLALTKLPTEGSIHRQIDIRLCPLESLPYMLLGNTGDDRLMKTLRYRAMQKGWVLNEYAMGERVEGSNGTWVKDGGEIMVNSEKEIFDKLELPYLEVCPDTLILEDLL
uniref:DNA polymerase n=1 Tax=Kwoniella dejecticola CBS 10117 TaxID=1296121 RepID=A0A1A6AEA9_9TREE|nr:uncharacterized protein I303_00194 [Kwoniella dejecticola CBS 10117]OBR88379.1 hypothetical protein I303_00194 [Kwoniella dejecticola CBS 10117]